MLQTFVRIALGVILAALVAGLVREVAAAYDGGRPVLWPAVWDYAVTNLSWVLPFAAIGAIAAEVLRLRHWVYYLGGGIAAALAATLIASDVFPPTFGSLNGALSLSLLASMGALGGLAYWASSGRKAGWAGAGYETALGESHSSLKDEWRGARRPRCWPCLLLGLGLAALPLLLLGGLMVEQPQLDRSIATAAEAQAKTALTEAGYHWASLRVDGHRGHIEGVAPNETQRAAAYATASKVLAPMVGIPGVVALLDNDITLTPPAVSVPLPSAPQPPIIVRPQPAAPAAIAAEVEAKRKADAEATRIAVEAEARRVAAEVEAKRVATEVEAKRVAAEAEARRLVAVDGEQKRLAADLSAKRQALEADQKRAAAEIEARRKADDEAKRLADLDKRQALEAEARRKADDEAKRLADLAAEAKRKSDAERAAAAAAAVPARARIPVGAACTADFQRLLTGGGITFRASSATITTASKTGLDQLAEAAKTCASFGFVVEGHADQTGNPDFNIKISGLRAEAVRAALIARGLPAARISAKGFGSSRLLDTAMTPDAHARNRRIEINIGMPPAN